MPPLEDNAALIPAEQVEACEAWQMPVLEAAGAVVASTARKKRDQSAAANDDPLSGPLTASKIERIRAQAQAEGFTQGRSEGYEQGMQEARAEVEETTTQLNRVMGHLMQPISQQDHELEQALVILMARIAKAVVKRDVEYDRELISDVVRQAVARLPEASRHIKILLHPQDAELVGRAILKRANDWQVIPNGEVERGGCVIKSEHSYIDYTLDAQFQLTLDQLLAEQFSAVPVGEAGADGGEPPASNTGGDGDAS